jgi:hypothetical protein
LSEQVCPYFEHGRESPRGKVFWSDLHSLLSMEFGLKSLSQLGYSYNTNWMGKTHTVTDSDLQMLGIPLGHRKKLLRGIEALKIGTVALHGAVEARIAQSEPRTQQAERRQLSVMFVDLVGSTELSLKLDPEEFRDLTRAYHDATAKEASRYSGHVSKYMGDGLLVYFGFTREHTRTMRFGQSTLG